MPECCGLDPHCAQTGLFDGGGGGVPFPPPPVVLQAERKEQRRTSSAMRFMATPQENLSAIRVSGRSGAKKQLFLAIRLVAGLLFSISCAIF
jgi:hypothetical protein